MIKYNVAGSILNGILALTGLGTDTILDFSDAPGGDLNLDDIFGDASGTPTTVEPQPNPPVTQQPTTPVATEPVIKTKTGTIYKSIGDAVEGIEHKDALIAQLREQVKQNTGNDPLNARRPTPVVSDNYIENHDKYIADINDAIEKKDTKRYMEIEQKKIWDALGPLAPTITALSRANAERVVSSELPEFSGFLASEQYQALSTQSPLLAEAIRSAELNPAQSQQLPELYKIAYLSSQGRRVPELIQSARTNTPVVQPRPTVHSTPVSAPALTGVATVAPSLDTKEGRKALIDNAERTGVFGLRF